MKIVNTVFSNDELDIIFNETNEVIKDGKFSVSKFVWQPVLHAGIDGNVFIKQVSEDLRSLVHSKLSKFFTIHELSCSHFFWDYRSGINWHHDDHVDWAATIYLNDVWQYDWGGFLYYKEKDTLETKVIYPQYNSMAISDCHEEHRVTPIMKKDKPLRYTLQIFGK